VITSWSTTPAMRITTQPSPLVGKKRLEAGHPAQAPAGSHREAPTAAFDQEPAWSIGHSVMVPGRTSTTTFRNPTRIGAAFPGRVVSRRTSGLTSTRMR